MLTGKGPFASVSRKIYGGFKGSRGLLRAGVILLAVLPLTGLMDRPALLPTELVLVVDDSLSMRARYPTLFDTLVTEWESMTEGRHPVVVARDAPVSAGEERAAEEEPTDLESSLKYASTLFTGDGERRIMVLSDGLADPQGTEELTAHLKDEGVKVYALSLPEPERQSAVVDISLPARVHLWESFWVRGRILSTGPGQVTAVFKRNGLVVKEETVAADRYGNAHVEFLQESDLIGPIIYSLEVKGQQPVPATGVVQVAASPRVLYVADDPEASEKLTGLYRQAGIDIVVEPSSELSLSARALESADIVVLDDVSFPALTEQVQELLKREIGEKGKGLLVIGGRKGLGSGEYGDSLLEDILPVEAGYATPPSLAPTAIVLAMDTSASMRLRPKWEKQFYTGTPRKIDIARESAKEVVKVVPPGDKIGVLRNSTDLLWIYPLSELHDEKSALEKVDGIVADGEGIYFYTVIKEAYRALLNEPAGIRHIMIFCDADDIDQHETPSEGHSFDLIQRMAREGISLSVLAVGHYSDKDVSFLRTATLVGRGDFYLVSNTLALPRYFVSDYKKALSPFFMEEEVTSFIGDYSVLMQGLQGPLPMIQGISTVTPNKTSRTPVITDLGSPLLVTGHFGSGKTAVFSSDNGYRWAPQWFQWPDSKKFWLQVLFSVAPKGKDQGGMNASLSVRPERGAFQFTYSPRDAAFPPWEDLWMHFDYPRRNIGPMRLVRSGLRSYESGAMLPDAGLYRVVITTDEGGRDKVTRAYVFVDSSAETKPYPNNREYLNRIVEETSGAWLSSPEQLMKGVNRGVGKGRLALFMLTSAIFLIFLEVLLKYRPWR